MKISEVKKDKISEQILAFLYSITPKLAFTAHIARETARDEEFIKKLLLLLKDKGLVVEVKKNPSGVTYLKRSRWKLSEMAYKTYQNYQPL